MQANNQARKEARKSSQIKKGDKMSYSFDKVTTNRWEELEDHYTSILDELAESDSESVFIPVDSFDVDEVL